MAGGQPTSPKPSKPNSGEKKKGKAGKKKNQQMILSADIYNYGTVYVGPREVDGEVQYEFIFGEDDYCINFRATFNDSKGQDKDNAASDSALLDNKNKYASKKTGAADTKSAAPPDTLSGELGMEQAIDPPVDSPSKEGGKK